MSRFRRIEIFEPHYAPVFLRETSIFTPKALAFPFFEEPEELTFSALDLFYSKPSTFDVFDTVADLVKPPSFCTYKSIHDRFETDLRLQTLSDRVSDLESKFDRLVNAKINAGSGAERKYKWTAEIKGPMTERKYKWTAEIKGHEEKEKKEEKVKNYKWTAEIKEKGEEEIPISRKYTFEASSGFAGEGGKPEKKEKEKKKEGKKEHKGECATRLVEIEDYPDHGAVVLRQAFAKRAGVVDKRKGKKKELTPLDAALLIQTTFKAYLIKRSQALRALRELAVAKSKLKELRALFNNFSYRSHVARDAEERQKFTEKIIVLLLTVDGIEGADLMVRAAKRSMVDELEAMLDVVDPQPAGRSLSMRRRTFDMPDGVIRKEIADGVAQVVQMLDKEENGTRTFEACLHQLTGHAMFDEFPSDPAVSSLLLLRFLSKKEIALSLDSRSRSLRFYKRMVCLKDTVPAAENNINRGQRQNNLGRPNRTCLALVADETASVHFHFWGDECDAFTSRTPNVSEITWMPDPNRSNKSLSIRRWTFVMPDGVIGKEIAEGVAQVVQMLDDEEIGIHTSKACLSEYGTEFERLQLTCDAMLDEVARTGLKFYFE
ncbi:unnamed protein product [Dovyalis caffra]|uniref:BAG family molecular chaperone regulator 7 n=1 Tax=Dovyalis caffra TaxID=77055 RepID=A0AAV1RKS1_9ROSI|nr:unnamed protein product [Dovyalis caffra]